MNQARVERPEKTGAERELKEGPAVADGPLGLLVALRVPDARSLLGKARRAWGADLGPDLNDLEAYLEPGAEALELPRMLIDGTWRESAANLRKLFHPTREEKRQLRELAASLHRKPDGGQ